MRRIIKPIRSSLALEQIFTQHLVSDDVRRS